MNFSRLVARVNETGEDFVLYDGVQFQNFDRLKELVGKDYSNLNDDLMGGINERNGERWTHFIYKNAAVVLSITFTYTPA